MADKNFETVETVEVNGIEYELDWLFEMGDDGELSDVRGDTVAIYQDGNQVGEFCNPTWGPFDDADDVKEKGIEFISFYMDKAAD